MYTQALSGFNSISHMLKAFERSYNRSFLDRGLIVISGFTFDFENRYMIHWYIQILNKC